MDAHLFTGRSKSADIGASADLFASVNQKSSLMERLNKRKIRKNQGLHYMNAALDLYVTSAFQNSVMIPATIAAISGFMKMVLNHLPSIVLTGM